MFLSGEIEKLKDRILFLEDVSVNLKAEDWTVWVLKVVINILLTTACLWVALKLQHCL